MRLSTDFQSCAFNKRQRSKQHKNFGTIFHGRGESKEICIHLFLPSHHKNTQSTNQNASNRKDYVSSNVCWRRRDVCETKFISKHCESVELIVTENMCIEIEGGLFSYEFVDTIVEDASTNFQDNQGALANTVDCKGVSCWRFDERILQVQMWKKPYRTSTMVLRCRRGIEMHTAVFVFDNTYQSHSIYMYVYSLFLW